MKIDGKPMRFSYSKMSTYQECPLRYKFKYIEKIPSAKRYYFEFGSSIHSALEFMHKTRPCPDSRRVCEEFSGPWLSKKWSDAGYPSPERYQQAHADGIAMLKAYHDRYSTLKKVFATEYNTFVDIDGLKVQVIVDRIDYVSAGKIRIVDYKTGKLVQRSPGQLMMYQKVLESDEGLLTLAKASVSSRIKRLIVKDTMYLHVPTLTEHVFERAKDSDVKAFWDAALTVADNIRSGKFEPTPGEKQCKWCEHKHRCTAFRDAGPEL